MQFHNPTENHQYDYDSELIWSDVLQSDMQEILQIIGTLLPQNLMTKITALSLTGIVNDPVKELEEVKMRN